uniref:peptidoglycan recognition protein family protein n=1 Tax=Klebsiella pneumoniae TaxID=573 RepID=UPI0021B14605
VGGKYPVSDEVLNVLIKLVADIAKRNNLGTLVKGESVTWHKMHAETACPGEYLLSRMDYIIEEANKINNEPTPVPQAPEAPVAPTKKSNEEIA